MPVQPELHEPPSLAVNMLCDRLLAVEPTEWLLLFLDIIDKAEQADPSERLIATLQAACASAPEAEKAAATEALRLYITHARRELRASEALRTAKERHEVLVIVPKSREMRALTAVFECEQVEARAYDTHIRYQRFPLKTEADPEAEAKEIDVVLVCMESEGNRLAANIVHDHVRTFHRPDLAVLCGMAMGIRPDKATVGDVVVANAVWDTGPRRLTHDSERSREQLYRVPDPLQNDLNRHATHGREDIQKQLRERLAAYLEDDHAVLGADQIADYAPTMRTGIILSGDTLVENNSGPQLAKKHDRAFALEMEGAGFAGACSHLGCDWTVLRGVADLGTPDRDSAWQWTSALAAGTFLKTFLEKTWTQPTVPSAGGLLSEDRLGNLKPPRSH